MYASKFTLPAAAVLNELHAWFYISSGPGGDSVRVVLYAADGGGGLPGTRLAYTGSKILPPAGDYELAEAGFNVPLPAGDYWIGFYCGTYIGNSFVYGEVTGGTHQGRTGGAPDPPSNPFGTPDTNGIRKHSVWAVVVDPTPPPVADFVSASVGGNQPAPLTFTDLSTGATSWLWDFGDGATSTAQNPTHAFPGAGTYSVSLTATNSVGSNTKTRLVTVAGPAPGSLPTSPGPSPIAVTDRLNASTGNGDVYTSALTVLFSYPRTGFSVAVFNAGVFYQIATIGINARDYRWEHGEHFLAPSFNSFNNPDHEGIAPGTKFGGVRIRAAAINNPATVIVV
jgi:hypothetical protein